VLAVLADRVGIVQQYLGHEGRRRISEEAIRARLNARAGRSGDEVAMKGE